MNSNASPFLDSASADYGIVLNRTFFEPDKSVTRAEFIKMLVRSLSCRYTFS